MLYFAYGSNLNHEQMHERCKDSKYLESFFLKGYNLFFCAINSNHGVANIIKKSASIVPGGVWEITTRDEKELDYYEGFPEKYTKDFFKFKGENVMFYIMKKQYSFKAPLREYVDIINQGYQDCNLDREYLKNRLEHINIDL